MTPSVHHTLLLLTSLALAEAATQTFTVGYITGSQRRPGDLEYSRPGLTISGAMSLAVEEVNEGVLPQKGLNLEFVVAETYGEERTSVRRIAELWRRNVSAIIGPQETCVHEAMMAAAFDLPIISYVSVILFVYCCLSTRSSFLLLVLYLFCFFVLWSFV